MATNEPERRAGAAHTIRYTATSEHLGVAPGSTSVAYLYEIGRAGVRTGYNMTFEFGHPRTSSSTAEAEAWITDNLGTIP